MSECNSKLSLTSANGSMMTSIHCPVDANDLPDVVPPINALNIDCPVSIDENMLNRLVSSINIDGGVKSEIESFASPPVDQVNVSARALLMTKISHKTKKRIEMKADASNFSFSYRQISKIKAHVFNVDDIRQIIDRDLARHYREELGLAQECERRWISIMYFNHTKQKLKCLHLVADTNQDLKKLLSTIQSFKDLKEQIFSTYLVNLLDLNEVKKSILADVYGSSDKTKKQELLYEDILKYCKRLDINLSPNRLVQMYESSKSPQLKGLGFEDFKSFVKQLRYRQDLALIWKDLTGSLKVMNFTQFQKFMTDVQEENLSELALEKLFGKFCKTNEQVWTCEDFNIFLNSKHMSCSREDFREEGYYSHPLSDYFILSSHNTYLLGRQFAGESSVAGYIRALQRGCRCVEIDIWNNSSDESLEPIVNHGRTFTSGIKLSDVLSTIKRYAFHSSNLPIILSLEIHCSIAAQKIAVECLRTIFGALLVLAPITGGGKLPSPEELKNKVLVKVKKSNTQSISVDESGNFMAASTSTTSATSTGASFSESAESFVTRSSSKSGLKLRRTKASLISEELSKLGIYCQGLKFRNFSLPESKTFNHCFSLNEKAINSMLKDTGKTESLNKHNRKFFMRVYPSKFRLNLSNFNPIIYWAHGVQMVATNWQTYDLGQQLNEAFFDCVYGSGYVLKPFELRRPSIKSTMRKQLKKPLKKVKFEIKVISAQQLHRPLIIEALNPFVSVEVFGTNSLTWNDRSAKMNTKLISGNGFNPVWNESFIGTFTCDYELVFFKFTVQTSASLKEIDGPKEVGVALINIFDLKKGFRYLRLKDFCGEQLLHSSLFVKIDFQVM